MSESKGEAAPGISTPSPPVLSQTKGSPPQKSLDSRPALSHSINAYVVRHMYLHIYV